MYSLTLSDGRIINMETTVEKFHELRFNVARVLREMQVLKQRFEADIMVTAKHGKKKDESQLKIDKEKEYQTRKTSKMLTASRIAGITNLKSAAVLKQMKDSSKHDITNIKNKTSIDETIDID